MSVETAVVSREDKKKEAIRRMKKMGVFDGVISDFEENDAVQYTDARDPLGPCFWLTDDMKAKVAELEKGDKRLIYHAIMQQTPFGMTVNYFYVCDERDEWEMDDDDLDHGHSVVYVENEDSPIDSEFGGIGFKLSPAGGLIRTY